MATSRFPKEWKKIQSDIINFRADGQCECLDTRECHASPNTHLQRCPARHGITVPGHKQPTKLTVVTVNDPHDFSPKSLRAYCDVCLAAYKGYNKKQEEERERMKTLATEMDTLFDTTPLSAGNAEEN